MIKREQLITDIWRRISSVTGVRKTARNPSTFPKAEDMPCINLFELSDQVTSARGDGQHYTRVFNFRLEIFVQGSSEEASSGELMLFLTDVLKAMDLKQKLGGMANFVETGWTPVAAVDAGNFCKAIGIDYSTQYAEDVSQR